MAESDNDALFRRLQKQFRADRAFSSKWRDGAKEDFDFVAGEQWSEEDKAKLKAQMRPIITMNRTGVVVNAVAGQEMSNTQEVRFIPREEGDVKPNEMLTEGARWFRDCASGEDEDSEAFVHTLITGMGWTDTTLDYEKDQAGEPQIAAVNPLEMVWDRNARKNNITDAERVCRVRSLTRAKAKEMFPDAEDADLDASWADTGKEEGDVKDQDRERLYQDDGDGDAPDDDKNVTIVHCQYIGKVPAWDVISPLTGEKSEMSDGDYKTYSKRAGELGLPVKAARKMKRVIRDCWLGAVVLQENDALCQDKFRYQCITGYRDENKGTFYGIVRAMKDPQRWANKWLLQTLDIMNSQAKGGVMIEEGAVSDMRKFEETWPRTDKPTTVPSGTLSNPNGPRIQPKPQGQFPAGFMQITEFAISAIRDVAGVSVEMLGMREADQPASLEFQRKQAGMVILQPLFKNLKRYRKENGHVILYILQHHLSDGRLIRVLGEENAKYIPLTKQADVKYDIIVDDAPTSPNQKEMIWSMIGDHFWTLPPDIQLALIEYSPFPSTVVEKIKKAAAASSQSPMAQMQQRMTELEAALTQAKTGLTQAQTQQASADAQKTMSEMGQGAPAEADPNLKLAIDHASNQGKLALQQDKQAGEARLNQQAQAADIMHQRVKLASDITLSREKAASDVTISAFKAKAAAEAAKNKPAPKGAS